ncbi:MAG: pentapeptide repeat-containing protein [Desulfobacterales bacterium]|nr:pentapeptide repeat-containing protein [Desulfobacterales bacterium]
MEYIQKPPTSALTREQALAKIEEMRSKGGQPPVAGLSFRGVSLTEQDLSGLDFSGADLSESDLTRADLSGARFFKANLRNASLFQAKLRRADFTGADLANANLEEADCQAAGFGMANLDDARLFNVNLEASTLSKARLINVDLRCAVMKNARMRETTVTGTDLTGADLRGADLSRCDVSGSIFNDADLRNARLRLVKNFEKAKWIGADIRDINFAGAYRLRRFVVDQNYLKEFRDRNSFFRALYFLWWVTSDCGRSILRWCVMIGALALMFAWLYSFVNIALGENDSWGTRLYFSIVTLTTLGYGDIVPLSPTARFVAMLEVMTGYIMLGGLLSIFNNKIARRGE